MSSEEADETIERPTASANEEHRRYQYSRHQETQPWTHWRPSRHGDYRSYHGTAHHSYQLPRRQPTSHYQGHHYGFAGSYEQGHWVEPLHPGETDQSPQSRAHYPSSRRWAERHPDEPPSPAHQHTQPRGVPFYPSSHSEHPLSQAGTATRNNWHWNSNKPRASRRLEWDTQQELGTETRWSFDEETPLPIALYERTGQHGNSLSTSTSGNVQDGGERRESSRKSSEFIFELRPYDVLCGRGVPTASNNGNTFFRDLVKDNQVEYISCRRSEKPAIATKIIEVVRSRGGRFLRRVRVMEPGAMDRFGWSELPENRCYEKVCQALRDGAPQIRQKMLELTKKERGKENSVNLHVKEEHIESNQGSRGTASPFKHSGVS